MLLHDQEIFLLSTPWKEGKRGGLRIIYYWEPKTESFYLLLVYPKSGQEDLTLAQVKVLKQLVCEEFK